MLKISFIIPLYHITFNILKDIFAHYNKNIFYILLQLYKSIIKAGRLIRPAHVIIYPHFLKCICFFSFFSTVSLFSSISSSNIILKEKFASTIDYKYYWGGYLGYLGYIGSGGEKSAVANKVLACTTAMGLGKGVGYDEVYNVTYGGGLNNCIAGKKTYVAHNQGVNPTKLPYVAEACRYYVTYESADANVWAKLTYPHLKYGNYLFLDGHAASVKEEVGRRNNTWKEWFYGSGKDWQ